MNPEIAKAILTLLQRTNLQGSEVEAFNVCCRTLQEIIDSAPSVEEESEEVSE